jgi:uncharacterized protein YutE (UPF0331/DUF86 family)
MDDVELNKAATLERCVLRIREEYKLSDGLRHFPHIDAMTLNIERACQASIDWAMHRIAKQKLGMPQSNAEAFELLCRHQILSHELTQSLKAMCGFSNIAVHEYQSLDLSIMNKVATEKVGDFETFAIAMGAKAFKS